MSPESFDPTLVDSRFTSTFMPDAPPTVALNAMTVTPAAAPGLMSRLFGVFGAAGPRGVHDAALVNAATSLYSERGLLELGARMMFHCHREREPIALVLLTFGKLDELRQGDRDKAAKAIARRCLRLAGARGLAARTGALEFALLMPGATVAEALAICRLEMGQYPHIACTVKRREVEMFAGVRAAQLTSSEFAEPALANVLSQALETVRGKPPLLMLASQEQASLAGPGVVAASLPKAAEAAVGPAPVRLEFPETMPAPLMR